jgi:uncharacterized protein (TIGR03083 family)
VRPDDPSGSASAGRGAGRSPRDLRSGAVAESWSGAREAFAEAAGWFVRTVGAVGGEWDRPGLGEWTVRDLVGHTSRALSTVETYLDRPAAAVDVPSAVDYYRLVLATAGSPAEVAERGRAAGAALGADPEVAVAALAERVVDRVAGAPPDSLVGTPVGGMRLADYLPSRTFELTVHTCDLAAALGVEQRVPAAAAAASLALAGGLAARAGRAAALLLAATGRGGLPDGYTVL